MFIDEKCIISDMILHSCDSLLILVWYRSLLIYSLIFFLVQLYDQNEFLENDTGHGLVDPNLDVVNCLKGTYFTQANFNFKLKKNQHFHKSTHTVQI